MFKTYLRVYKIFVKNSFSYEAQYRRDTIMKIFTNLLYVGMLFLVIEIIFSHTDTVAGWSKETVYLMGILWVIMDETFICLFRENFYNLSLRMTRGDLDITLTKPLNTLFLVSTKQLLIRAFYRLIVQLIILVWLLTHYYFNIPLAGALLVLPLMLVGLWINFSLSLIGNTLSFWLMKIENINDAIASVNSIGRYPLGIWPRTLKILFLTALPVAFSAYIPVATLVGRWPWYGVLYAFIFAGLLFFTAVQFWNFALRRYSSASS